MSSIIYVNKNVLLGAYRSILLSFETLNNILYVLVRTLLVREYTGSTHTPLISVLQITNVAKTIVCVIGR